MPHNKKKVLLGMSGGVDSSVAAILLQDQGYDVIGVTMKLWHDERFEVKESSELRSDGVGDAKALCDLLGIRHYTLDLGDAFKKYVVNNFIECYSHCRTPNPCVECNRKLKFGELIKFADELGAEFISTGHYAKRCFDERLGLEVIKKSDCEKKDQSYVLYVINRRDIPRILFPLGDFKSKEQIRKIAEERGFALAEKPDSQEICFIPDDNISGFIDSYIKPVSGNIIDKNGNVLGKHKGLAHYTIGQRRKLGVSSDKPLFVTKLDERTNTVIVGGNEDLLITELYATNINWLIFDALESPLKASAKIRYSGKEASAQIIPCGNDKIKVVFDEPQRAATPGQSVVFYIDDCVIGGGIISL